MNREVRNFVFERLACHRIVVGNETTSKVGVFRAQIPDNLQFFPFTVDIVHNHIGSRHVAVFACVDLFRDIEQVNGLTYKERGFRRTHTVHTRNVLLNPFNGDCQILIRNNGIGHARKGGNRFSVRIHDGIARIEGAYV